MKFKHNIYEMQIILITKWKKEFIDRGGEIFDNPTAKERKKDH